MSVEKKITDILTPILAPLFLSLWDVEFKKTGSDYVLSVFIDKDGGASIDDCEKVSIALGSILDNDDLISTSYVLEVCSAGLERSLKKEAHFLQFLGRDVRVKLYSPIDGKKEFIATLKDYSNEQIQLEIEGTELILPVEKVASVKLLYIERKGLKK